MSIRLRCIPLLTAALTLISLAAAYAESGDAADLIAVIESDAGAFEKADACRRIALADDPDAVAALADLLDDPQLSSYARMALEDISDASAGDALLAAVSELEGVYLVGAINSLGARGDADAVPALVGLVDATDADVASAALASLGRLGGPEADEALVGALTSTSASVRTAAADAALDAAEALVAEGETRGAARLYNRVRRSRVPQYLRLAGTCGLIVAQGADGIPMLLRTLDSDDDDSVEIGLRAVRMMQGQELTDALIDELTAATPAVQARLIVALAERDDERMKDAILAAATSGPTEAQLAALSVIGRLGSDDALACVRKGVASDNDAVRAAAIEAFVDIALADTDSTSEYLLEALGYARQPGELITVLEHVGRIDGVDWLEVVLPLLDAQDGELRSTAATAVATAALRLADGEAQRAAELAELASAHRLDAGLLGRIDGALKAQGITIDLAARQGFIADWRLLGPVGTRAGMLDADAVPTDRPIDTAQAVAYDGGAISWTPWVVDGPTGVVDLLQALAPKNDTAGYGYAEFDCAAAMDAKLMIGADDDVYVWLNGELVLRNNQGGACIPDEDVIEVRLVEGRNYLLLKVLNGSSAWGLAARVTDADGQPLGLVQADLPSGDQP